MSASRVIRTDSLHIVEGEPLARMYHLSPYVWREGDRFGIAIRAVNRSKDPNEKISRIYFGDGQDGLEFSLAETPSLLPGLGPDSRGCEDPTVLRVEDEIHVVYSGYDGKESRMLRAAGPTLDALEKRGELFPDHNGFKMAKEAAVVPSTEGLRLLFEYATEEASRIGQAVGTSLDGPFALSASPILPRPGRWDSFHLSPCDSVEWRGRRILIYSGADRETRWRIGWAELDGDGSVVMRAKEPLIVPFGLEGEDTDIAFAASAIVHKGELWIYYSVADRSLYRSLVEIGDDGEVPNKGSAGTLAS